VYNEWVTSAISEEARIRGQITELRPRVTDATLRATLALAEKINVAGAGGGGSVVEVAAPVVPLARRRRRSRSALALLAVSRPTWPLH
jgi:hypothetical protein